MFISKKNFVALVVLSVTALVLVAFIATNLLKGHRKKIEDARMEEVVSAGTGHLRESLGKEPTVAMVPKIEGYLQNARTSPNPAMGAAAEAYLIGAREIARQRANGERLTREAAAARSALAGHMARAEHRSTTWIKDATELKRRVEMSYADLNRSLKTLDDLLAGLPESEKRLAEYVPAKAMLEPGEIDAARKRAQDDAKRAAGELEQVRRIVP